MKHIIFTCSVAKKQCGGVETVREKMCGRAGERAEEAAEEAATSRDKEFSQSSRNIKIWRMAREG